MNLEARLTIPPQEEATPEVDYEKMSDTTIEKFIEEHIEDKQIADELAEKIKEIDGDTQDERFDKIKNFIRYNIGEYIKGIAFTLVVAAYQLKPTKKPTPKQIKDKEDFNKLIDKDFSDPYESYK